MRQKNDSDGDKGEKERTTAAVKHECMPRRHRYSNNDSQARSASLKKYFFSRTFQKCDQSDFAFFHATSAVTHDR